MGRDTAELDPSLLPGYDARLMGAGVWGTARELPVVTGRVLRLAWSAGRRATLGLLALQTLSAAVTGFALLAGTAVLSALLASGPTPDRIRAALPALLVMAGAYALRGLADAGVADLQARLTPRVQRVAEDRFHTAIVGVELPAFDDPDWHDAMSRSRDRGLTYTEMAVEQLVETVSALVGLLAVAGVLGVLHPLLVPLLALSVLPQAWAALSTARHSYTGALRLATLRRRQLMVGDLLSQRAPAAEIRACTAEDFLLGEYRALAATVEAERRRVELAGARRTTLGRTLGGTATLGLFVVLGWLLAEGMMPLAVAGTAVVAVRLGQAGLLRLSTVANRLYEQGLYIADLETFIGDSRARRPEPTGRPAPADFEELVLDGVGFRYPGADRDALRDVHMRVRRGEVIALVGENGSGKSTLARLLAGLYRPDTGTIRWDGVDTAGLDPAGVRERVALVPQEAARWPLTARENITIGRHRRPDPADRALGEAARFSGADRIIARLPGGYDTMLSRCFAGGAELSGGQWQSVSIARAVYRDAPLLICDEPTSALDPRAEHRVYESFRRLAGRGADGGPERTVVLITHRMASVRHADRIYVLDRGALAEVGGHEELMALDGIYAGLYRTQAAAFREEPPVPAC
ncbi:ABC transporter ATP-binding protein [Actinomadura hibisca]|uniref:ABC transporter ATP-binding protein n=1 Tax=Actinomadura hibisca TaxID=68565 RepID=UPI00082C20BE|nr:ATP-binding cassette domain-containing protein [Actinomadura hibisca]